MSPIPKEFTRTEYNDLIDKSFNLLLQYRVFYSYTTFSIRDHTDICFNISNEEMESFLNLYSETNTSILLTVNSIVKTLKQNNSEFITTYKREYIEKHFTRILPYHVFKDLSTNNLININDNIIGLSLSEFSKLHFYDMCLT